MSATPILDGFYKDIVEQVDAYNKALAANDFASMSRIETALKEAEAGYAEAKAVQVFTLCKETENPILKAVEVYGYDVVSHRMVRDDGKITGFEVVDDRRKQIDLVKLCKFCGLDYLWQYKVEKFGQLLCLRVANELKMTKAQIKKICDSYYMDKLSQQEDLGKTPDSNTQICKQLQMVVDSILYADNGSGKNSYRVNAHDVAYLLMCYTKRSNRKTLTITVSKASYVHSLVMDVMHRILTGKQYDLDYKMVKEKSESTKESEPVKGSEPETETVVVPNEAKSATAIAPEMIDDSLPSIEEFLNA